jgi:hypothetical protein
MKSLTLSNRQYDFTNENFVCQINMEITMKESEKSRKNSNKDSHYHIYDVGHTYCL